MSLLLGALSREDCELVRQWRNRDLSPWRTPYPLTEAMQEEFYREVVSNRHAAARYWAVRQEPALGGLLVAMVGLAPIRWGDGFAEVTLTVDPHRHGQGVGTEAVALLLEEAFDQLRLLTVFGECYASNPRGLAFWENLARHYQAEMTWLPRRKWWGGKLWPALAFTISDGGWRAARYNHLRQEAAHGQAQA